MPSRDPKFIASNRPVNSRTWTKKNTTPQDGMSKERSEQQNTHSMKLRNSLKNRFKNHIIKHQKVQQFGLDLLKQLNATDTNQHRNKPNAMMVVGALFGSASMITLVLMAIQQSWGLATIAGTSMVFSAGLMLYARSKPIIDDANGIASPTLFEFASVQAFDQALACIEDELSDELRTQLIAFKHQIYRLALLAQQNNHLNILSAESRYYLNQSLLRYLPDSLQSYLRIPIATRNSQIIDQDCTAEQLLIKQISMLQQEFEKYEREFNRSAAEELIQQQRFLELKRQEQDTA